MLIENHVKIYSKEEITDIINKYFANDELDEKERFVLMGILQKYAELLDIYRYSNLIKYVDYIKRELKLGIFESIVIKNKKYTNKERKKLVKLSYKWNRDVLEKYQNLETLKNRLISLPQEKQNQNYINSINNISKMNIKQIIDNAESIKERIQDMYLYYEIKNRQNIINKSYQPEKKEEIIIDDLSKINGGLILHFFWPYTKIFHFENYLNKLENKLQRKLTQDEKKMARKKFEVMSNNFIVNQSVPLTAIGQTNEAHRYSVDIHNQLSCTFVTAKDIVELKGVRGNLALGFAKDKLEPDQIATISDKNIHSNKNIENVETSNDFKDFSASYNELLNKDANEFNTELVMFRNTDMTTLRPSYVLYISYTDINSKNEKRNIEICKDHMKEAGLDVPFIIFDNYSIYKKIENEKER